MFNNIYKNKKVLITGNTGFKGSWLTVWLLNMGAEVVGLSNGIPTTPSMFEVLQLEEKIKHYEADVRDINSVSKIINSERPDFVFHLAAQAIVSMSYDNPVETITCNAIGTMNVLEVLRLYDFPCTAVLITSDKTYDNVEQVWGYKENDQVGGKDIYSGSKGAADLIIKSYYHSFLKKADPKIAIAVGRAGNVIGGGDWAKDRIVVDCMKAWDIEDKVAIRSPNATRPWQHVLEPLSGYLALGEMLYQNKENLNGYTFNFGPRSEQNKTVVQLMKDLCKYWKLDSENAFTIVDNIPFHEAGLLKLNCDKALFYLNWEATLEYIDTVRLTGTWYYDYYKNDFNMYDITNEQINEYEDLAKKRNIKWALK